MNEVWRVVAHLQDGAKLTMLVRNTPDAWCALTNSLLQPRMAVLQVSGEITYSNYPLARFEMPEHAGDEYEGNWHWKAEKFEPAIAGDAVPE